MLIRKSTGVVLAGVLVLAASGAILAGQGGGTTQEKEGKELKKVAVPYSKPGSGAEMYKDYCAACHGTAGKGEGPAVEFLKAPPSDLTTMAQRNGGKFPAEHFEAILRFGTEKHPHGTTDMPIWGQLFAARDKNTTPLRIHNLSSYVESLQQK